MFLFDVFDVVKVVPILFSDSKVSVPAVDTLVQPDPSTSALGANKAVVWALATVNPDTSRFALTVNDVAVAVFSLRNLLAWNSALSVACSIGDHGIGIEGSRLILDALLLLGEALLLEGDALLFEGKALRLIFDALLL